MGKKVKRILSIGVILLGCGLLAAVLYMGKGNIPVDLSFYGVGSPYKEENILGKSSREIVREYGEFDHTFAKAGEDGIYRNTSCGYVIREKRVGALGTDPAEYYFIGFNEDGVAESCRVGVIPGG